MEVVRISNEGSENWILYCISNTDMIEFAIGLDAGMELQREKLTMTLKTLTDQLE